MQDLPRGVVQAGESNPITVLFQDHGACTKVSTEDLQRASSIQQPIKQTIQDVQHTHYIAQALTSFLSIVKETAQTQPSSTGLSLLETLFQESITHDPAYLVHLEDMNKDTPKHKKRPVISQINAQLYRTFTIINIQDEPLQVWLPY
ncbi:hypothetical protein C0995_011725 [Termitomyces sp. Mi166|nr:hypothetical protein C0995_011725 [Termitomyces sp. Mi166\